MTEKKCDYDYDNKCDCSEDDNCGCNYPNNLSHDFNNTCVCECTEEKNGGWKTSKEKITIKTPHVKIKDDSTCTCSPTHCDCTIIHEEKS